jgi:hypothetical protein
VSTAYKFVQDQESADAIRERLRSGESVRDIAASIGAGYMVVYRIATGKTWTNGESERLVAQRAPKRFTAEVRDQFFFQKLQTGCSNKDVALMAGCSESMAARMMRDAEIVWSRRIMVSCMRSGSDDMAMERHGFTREQIQALYLVLNEKRPVPARLEGELKNIERV